MADEASRHRQLVVDQFGKQAASFAQLPSHEEATRLLIEMAEVGSADDVLDVACGPGLVACAVALHVRHVIGIDLTPAMIGQARDLQLRRGLSNVEWHRGDAAALPFAAGRFSAVMTRYSLHHCTAPGLVVAEMARVARPGGRVVVADLVLPPEKGPAYDRMERLRDPSHVRVLSEDELGELMVQAGLLDWHRGGYLFELELETLLRGSFPDPGNAERLRELFAEDVGVDRLGIGIHRRGGETWFAYPVVIAAGRKPT